MQCQFLTVGFHSLDALYTVVVFFLAFFLIVGIKRYRGTIEFRLTGRMALWFLLLAVFDMLGVYMIILSVTYVSAPIATLLAQVY